jgi:hypothetical protein
MPSNCTPAPSHHAGILLIRVWVQEDAPGQLRARLMQAADLTEAPTSLAAAIGVRGVCDAVEVWLEAFLRQQSRDGPR